MTKAADQHGAEFQRGWDAAILAARGLARGEGKAGPRAVAAHPVPKNLEREAEVHKHSAEMMMTLSPDDV